MDDVRPHPLEPSWQRTRAQLAAAERCLVRFGELGLADFREYLSHNELGLAFEELVFAADAVAADPVVWRHLDAAAREMRLYEDDSPHATAAARCRRRVGESSG